MSGPVAFGQITFSSDHDCFFFCTDHQQTPILPSLFLFIPRCVCAQAPSEDLLALPGELSTALRAKRLPSSSQRSKLADIRSQCLRRMDSDPDSARNLLHSDKPSIYPTATASAVNSGLHRPEPVGMTNKTFAASTQGVAVGLPRHSATSEARGSPHQLPLRPGRRGHRGRGHPDRHRRLAVRQTVLRPDAPLAPAEGGRADR